MQLNQSIYDALKSKASETTIETVNLGLGYTAVTTNDGGIGLAYTYFDKKSSCVVNKGYEDYEGRPAIDLLKRLFDTEPLKRSPALALANALNYQSAMSMREAGDNDALFDRLAIRSGTRVAMVGLFPPLIPLLKERGAEVTVVDEGKAVGDEAAFFTHLREGTEVLILTATSILNNSTESILEAAGGKARTVMLGPSTPMMPDVMPPSIDILAGMVPVDQEKVLKAVRHGTGTPVIQKFSRKVTWFRA